MGVQPTRRAVLGALAIAAPATAAAQPIMLVCSPVDPDPVFRRLVNRWRDLRAMCSAFYDQRVEPAERAHFEAREAWKAECEALPHYTTKATYETMAGPDRALCTDHYLDISLAKVFADKASEPQAQAAAQELLAALEVRERQKQALPSYLRHRAADADYDRAGEEHSARLDLSRSALEAIMAHPATSAAVLREKLALLAEDDWELDGFAEDIRADVERLVDGRA